MGGSMSIQESIHGEDKDTDSIAEEIEADIVDSK
jgi:hypothetical protein